MTKQILDLSWEIFVTDPTNVFINDKKIGELAEQMKSDGKVNFYDTEPNQGYRTGVFIDILKELVANSINYCYWYGSHDIRPNGVSSTSMYDDVNKVFEDCKNHALNFSTRINNLIRILSEHRYPLLEERKRHLLELCEERKAETFAKMVEKKELSGEALLHDMIYKFQGFASDLFLKRASLFFIQLNRKFGWWENDFMLNLHVPADYQVPKILRHFKCIEYTNELSDIIKRNELIPKHSLIELQIRAATVLACNMLQDKTGWTIADIDTYLWTKRKLTTEPFHLTITTDY
jgi:hypothetical protein